MGDRALSIEDLTGMIRGHNAVLVMLTKVFPGLPSEDLVEKAQQIEAAPVAVELLFQVLEAKKIKP